MTFSSLLNLLTSSSGMNPTLDSIIADLESKIREGNFFDLYADPSKGSLVAKNVNELFIKDWITESFQDSSLGFVVTAIRLTYARNAEPRRTTLRFSTCRPFSDNNRAGFKCCTNTRILSVSRTLSNAFDKAWRKEMSEIQDSVSRELTRKLQLFSTIRKLHSESNSYFCSLPRDMSKYLIGPMADFENDDETPAS